MGFKSKILLFLLVPILASYYILSEYKINDEELRGKRVLVTGASAGIGEEIAYRYARAGTRLMITARRQELLQKVAKKCKELGAKSVSLVSADMAVASDRVKVFKATEKELGELDVLILNHAYIKGSKFVNVPAEEYMKMLNNTYEINFAAYVHLTSLFLPTLEKSGGSIGVVSSLAGKVGFIMLNHYSALKHALQGFYASLRQELRYKKSPISITLVVYGGVDSENTQNASKNMDPEFIKEMQKYIAPTDDAAAALVGGVQARHYEMYYPPSAHVMALVNRIIPHQLENFITWIYGDAMVQLV